MELREWLELAFVGLVTMAVGWIRTEHKTIKGKIEDLEKHDSEVNTRLAVIEERQEANKEHIDKRFDGIEEKFNKLFERFEKYDEDRLNFFKNFELKAKQ